MERLLVDTNMMERFSLAYLEAVASQAGCWIAEPRIDRNSVDGILRGESSGRPCAIDFQAKATSQDIVHGDHLSFRLPINNYDDLRLTTRFPRILIVLLMPKEIDDWLNQTEEELCMRHCAYWRSIEGEPDVPNKDNVTVPIPLSKMFNGDQLTDMMNRADRGEPL